MRWAAALGLVTLVLAGRAAGHSVLVGSSVSLEQAVLRPNVEARLVLRFSGTIKGRESGIEVVPEHGPPRPLPLIFGPQPGDVTATCPPLAPGRYQLRYHMFSADGHVNEGTLPLRVAPVD